MASEKSYGATLTNNLTELDAISYLLLQDSNFIKLDKTKRAFVMNALGLEKSYARAFDLIYTISGNTDIESMQPNDILLVELKTTRKKLVHNPIGFFFGATENEFKLARKMGEKYKFCFISLHKESKSFALLSLDELESRIRTKRIQYQINL